RRPRGRPREFDRDAALDVAVAVFWARGYEGASVDDLTLAMGLNRSSLYRAFGDKHALFRAALARYGETSGAAPMRALRAHPGPARDALRAFLHAAVDAQTRAGQPRGCLVTCVATDAAGTHPDVAAEARAVYRATDRLLAEYVHEAQARGELPADLDADVLATTLSALMHSLSLRARAGTARTALRALADRAFDALVPA
ncbi:MAG: TetR/AcrR family transcriptional regulator, partial [Gemmatimonadaceae bacterium]|nr:TetR/AcrR family transcriptional regulator [Gemmatimonadaceae bacterium]